jgi:hypothetical protein
MTGDVVDSCLYSLVVCVVGDVEVLAEGSGVIVVSDGVGRCCGS